MRDEKETNKHDCSRTVQDVIGQTYTAADGNTLRVFFNCRTGHWTLRVYRLHLSTT